MPNITLLPKHEIVLLGVGHTNAHVLRKWRMAPMADTRLTCVSNYGWATYSGMLPGTLAGLYPPERMQIDLSRLCAAAGARLILAEVEGLDLPNRRLRFADRPPLPFDVLSIGIGSVPRRDGLVETGDLLLPIKPMQTFLPRLAVRLESLGPRTSDRPLRVAIVGGGAGGVEITFCLAPYLRQRGIAAELTLIDSHDQILTAMPAGAVAKTVALLESRGVRLRLGQAVQEIAADGLRFGDGTRLPADLVLWVTSAAAPPLLSQLGLPTTPEGFLETLPTLRTTADAPIFVVGDSGACPTQPTPRAGVYAVRQGPVLWENLRRQLRAEPLVAFEPQSGFLSLLATGDGRALLSYKGLTAYGRWCWRLKNWIDGRFMDKHQDYRPRPADMAGGQAEAMRCAGCGGKASGGVLTRALARLSIPASDHVLLGLDRPDDAAIVRAPGGRPIVTTVDFFAAFLDDPYLVGRIAALNALSDCFAMRAAPFAALALATLPLGDPEQQEELLYQLLAGGLEELRAAGATLVGGHTIEGPHTTLGFTVLADAGAEPLGLKSGLRPGDNLVLTKPLGSGILLAAHRQALCRAEWMQDLLAAMLTSNREAAATAERFGLAGMTDITGFGLAGHLLEMLRASRLSAEVRLDDLPLMSGVTSLVAAGIESTLAPANRDMACELNDLRSAETRSGPIAERAQAAYAALFDPQTSGGLLLGVPDERLPDVLEDLKDRGISCRAIIGRALPADEPGPTLRLI